MLKVYVIFFVKAVKKLPFRVFIQQVLFWVSFAVLVWGFFKIKLMKLSCLQIFLWL